MNKKLFLLCGIPGSGKSTWARKKARRLEDIVISRDEIRFSLLKEGESYFAHEDEVFHQFITKIQHMIDVKTIENIYVDATHLNEISRNKVLNCLKLDNVELIAVNFLIPIETCLERNEKRVGLSKVPRNQIKRMFYSLRPACYNEKFHYDKIINIKPKEKGK